MSWPSSSAMPSLPDALNPAKLISKWTAENNAENAKRAKNAAKKAANNAMRAAANPYGEAGVRLNNAMLASQHQGQGAAGLAALAEGTSAAAAPQFRAPVFAPAPGGGGPLHPGVNPAMRAAVMSGIPYVPGRNRGGRRRKSRKSRKAGRKTRSRK